MLYRIYDIAANEAFDFDTFPDTDDAPYMQMADRFDPEFLSWGLLSWIEDASDALVNRRPDLDGHLAPLGMRLARPGE